MITGHLQKMKTRLEPTVAYEMRVGEERIVLNALLEKTISLSFTGKIACIQCGRKTSKSFQQGFCFSCFRRLQECNMCIIHPERCLVEQGGCPEDDWAHAQCHASQIVYLANSSGLKVGITRDTQVPTRWMDQGARQALPIFTASNRYQSGVLEVALKAFVADKTNWRTMLKQTVPMIDLLAERDRLFKEAEKEINQALAISGEGNARFLPDEKPIEIRYPVLHYPAKVSSLSLDKTPEISGKLLGIKGQYLILEHGVLNVRKFGGYEVCFGVSDV